MIDFVSSVDPPMHSPTGLFWSKSQILLFHPYTVYFSMFIKGSYRNKHNIFSTYKLSTVVFFLLYTNILSELKYPRDSKILFHRLFNSLCKQGLNVVYRWYVYWVLCDLKVFASIFFVFLETYLLKKQVICSKETSIFLILLIASPHLFS